MGAGGEVAGALVSLTLCHNGGLTRRFGVGVAR